MFWDRRFRAVHYGRPAQIVVARRFFMLAIFPLRFCVVNATNAKLSFSVGAPGTTFAKWNGSLKTTFGLLQEETNVAVHSVPPSTLSVAADGPVMLIIT